MNDDGNEKTPPKMLGGVTGKGFMPGQSGNPSGRPRKGLLTDCYKAVIEQPLPEDLRVGLKLPEGATYGEAIALGQARAAIKGKTDTAREIADRLEGGHGSGSMSRAGEGVPLNLADHCEGPAAEGCEERRQEATAR